jgi:hypothetical protein
MPLEFYFVYLSVYLFMYHSRYSKIHVMNLCESDFFTLSQIFPKWQLYKIMSRYLSYEIYFYCLLG